MQFYLHQGPLRPGLINKGVSPPEESRAIKHLIQPGPGGSLGLAKQ